MQPSSFQPKNIPSLAGKVFFITGGTAGLGAGTIKLLSAHSPAHIYFSGRNASKAETVTAPLKSQFPGVPITFITCDLASLESVQTAAREFLAQAPRLDVLVCNAGIMALPPGVTKDGYEIQFGTNHLGHALLIKLLTPLLLRTAEQPNSDVRIVNMSSIAYKNAPSAGIDFATLKSPQASIGSLTKPGKWARYGQSKLANLLYAQQLAKHYPTITSVSVHPGFIKTDLFSNAGFFTSLPTKIVAPLNGGWTSVEEGPYNQVWAATTAKTNLEQGAYYMPVAKKGSLDTAQARDEKLAAKLWDWTQKELESWN